MAPQDGVGKKPDPPALRTGNGELRPLSSGTTLLTESDFCPRKPPYREEERVEREREREGERNAQNRNQSMASRFSTAFVGMFTNHFLMEIVAARPSDGSA